MDLWDADAADPLFGLGDDYVSYDSSSFTTPDISTDPSWMSDLSMTAPTVDSPLTSSGAFGTGIVSPDSSSSDFSWSGLTQLLQSGVQAYAGVNAIANQPAGTAPPPWTQQPPAGSSSTPAPGSYADTQQAAASGSSAAPASSFDWSQLTNFQTPYPYIAGAGVLLLVMAMGGRRR